jgi:hypothetical protein
MEPDDGAKYLRVQKIKENAKVVMEATKQLTQMRADHFDRPR